jgi:hypothetical protein
MEPFLWKAFSAKSKILKTISKCSLDHHFKEQGMLRTHTRVFGVLAKGPETHLEMTSRNCLNVTLQCSWEG